MFKDKTKTAEPTKTVKVQTRDAEHPGAIPGRVDAPDKPYVDNGRHEAARRVTVRRVG